MSGLKYTLVVRNPEGSAVALLAGAEVPELAADLVRPEDFEDFEEVKPFSKWKVDDLRAEVARRNEGRSEDAQIADGTKAELVAALEADDAKPE